MKIKLIGLALSLSIALIGTSCKNDSAKTAQATVGEKVEQTANNAANPANIQTAAPVLPLTRVELPESEFDFGTITIGESATHVYKIKNVGSEPLVISDAKGSCGCTVPTWSKEPIAPGKEGEMEVVFNSAGKPSGPVSKQVTITANTDPAQSFLIIKGNLKEGKAAAATTGKK